VLLLYLAIIVSSKRKRNEITITTMPTWNATNIQRTGWDRGHVSGQYFSWQILLRFLWSRGLIAFPCCILLCSLRKTKKGFEHLWIR
jgi:hypothetical protein